MVVVRPLAVATVGDWAVGNPTTWRLPVLGDLVATRLADQLAAAPTGDPTPVEWTVVHGDTVASVADRLELEVTDEAVEALVREQAETMGEDPEQALAQLREGDRFETLREDMRLRDALDRVAAEVKRIPRDLAEAREAIWTPDKEKRPAETKLWTPGSEGAT